MNLRFAPEARRHLREIRAYIGQHDERAADNVLSRIQQAIMMFERFPLLGREGRVEGVVRVRSAPAA